VVLRSDASDGPFASPEFVLGSDIKRTQIGSIIFVDSLSATPADAWDVSADGSGDAKAWVVSRADDLYDLYIGGEGGIIANANSSHLFHGYEKVQEISFNGVFDTSKVTDMSFMFGGFGDGLLELDLSGFDTSHVKNMMAMFSGCDVVNLDVSSFDTSNVTNMVGMFNYCQALLELDLSNFDTSNVKTMSEMFSGCEALQKLDVRSFDTSNVTNMNYMFGLCENLIMLDLSSFDTSNVETMGRMFEGCTQLTGIFVHPENFMFAENTTDMFAGCGTDEVTYFKQ